jgi:uncharacterized repeat protein (TIGR01451 family)
MWTSLTFAAVMLASWAATPAAKMGVSGQGPASARSIANGLDIDLVIHSSGFRAPVDISAPEAPWDERLFISERRGLVHIVYADGQRSSTPFLDIQAKVVAGSERGLLAVTFDPLFAKNGRFYALYSRAGDGATVIARYGVSHPNASFADPDSELVLLVVDQPYTNHNGGDLRFGPDGLLYISLGDGGSGGDPDNRAQDLTTLLGKILRIDVDPTGGHPPDCGSMAALTYSIPADNPFRDGSGGDCDEIWASGLRNPWRISLDAVSMDIFVSDVGQNRWEEVNILPLVDSKGANFGWRCFEGAERFNSSGCSSDLTAYEFPSFSYPHGPPDNHCSVIGGDVYRGGRFPSMTGRYFVSDFCSGELWDLVRSSPSDWISTTHGSMVSRPSTFGVGADGEMYVASLSSGNIYHLVEKTPGPRLGIDKRGPTIGRSGEPITYTLTVSNSGALTATSVIVSDTLPATASYFGNSHGGVLQGGVVRWSLPSLAPGSSISRQLMVTAPETIRNERYQVAAEGGYWSYGVDSVLTLVDPRFTYLPAIRRP